MSRPISHERLVTWQTRQEGFCYLKLFRRASRFRMANLLGVRPTLERVLAHLEPEATHVFGNVAVRFCALRGFHVEWTERSNCTDRALLRDWFSGNVFPEMARRWIGSESDPSFVDASESIVRATPQQNLSLVWKDVSRMKPADTNDIIVERYDDEFWYLHLFQNKYRHEIALSLGRSPSVDVIFHVPIWKAHRLYAHVYHSADDDSTLYLATGNMDVWLYLKSRCGSLAVPTLGPRSSPECPTPASYGCCYLAAFEFYCQRNVYQRLQAWPTLGEVHYLESFDRARISVKLSRSRGIAGFWHCESTDLGVDLVDWIERTSESNPNDRIGGDENVSTSTTLYRQPYVEDDHEEDSKSVVSRSSTDVTHPTPTRVSTFGELTETPDDHESAEVTHVEVMAALFDEPLSGVSMDFPGEVVEVFDVGYCYLGLVRKNYRDDAKKILGRCPTVDQLSKVRLEHREDAVGVVSALLFDEADFHISYERRGVNLWREIERLHLEDPAYTVGLDRNKFTVQLKQVYQQTTILFGKFWFIALLFSMLMYNLLTSWFNVIALISFILLLMLAALFIDLFVHDIVSLCLTITPIPGSFITAHLATIAIAIAQASWSRAVIHMLSLSVLGVTQIVRTVYTLRRTVKFGLVIRNLIACLLENIVHSARSMFDGRQYQAASDIDNKFVKAILSAIASICTVVANTSVSMTTKQLARKLAGIFRTLANTMDVPRAYRDMEGIVIDTMQSSSLPVNHVSGEGFDLSSDAFEPEEIAIMEQEDHEKPDRTFQSSDDIPFGSFRHLVTKGNINKISEMVAEKGRGEVHIVTAATGTGKSTVVPYLLSRGAQKDVYVVIPTILAAKSSARVIQDRFGCRPHLQVDSERHEGNTNIWVVTSKTFIGKLMHDPTLPDRAEAIIFDEMHVNSAENFLFRNISKRISRNTYVLWCSATFAQSFTLPGDLTHPVVERIDKSVTLKNIFTPRCTVKGASPTTVRGRYFVFCASVRDTERVKSRFKGSGILAFAISSKNMSTEMPKAERALRDQSNTTVIVATTPCNETGVTVPLNYVIDLREQIVACMTYDPNALSTKRIPVTAGMATQRKGRVGRLFRGIYIAPPVEYTPTTAINESDLSLAVVYSRLFGISSPVKRELKFLDSQALTDTFITNVMATRLDPIAVAGMSSPEGRLFKSFESFVFPQGVDKKKIVFSGAHFPHSVWEKWPRFATSEWKQWLDKENREQVGNHVRAPFWDFTVDDKIQIDNWQLKVFCYRDIDISDSRYSEPAFMKTVIAKRLRESWLWQGGRKFQMASFEPASVDVDDTDETVFTPESTDDSDDSYDFVETEEIPQVPLREQYAGSTVLTNWILYTVCRDAPWTMLLFVVLAYLLIFGVGFILARKVIRTITNAVHRGQKPEPVVESNQRNLEREYVIEGPGKPGRSRMMWESRKRNWMPYDSDFHPDDWATIDFDDQYGSRRCRIRDIDAELDNYFDDDENRAAKWADQAATIRYDDDFDNKLVTEVYESNKSVSRGHESKVPAKTPEYGLRSARSSIVSFSRAGVCSHIGFAVIVRGFIFCNTHVLRACGTEVRMKSQRGEFIFKPVIAMEENDLTVIHLPPGVSGSAANFPIRSPEPGESVCLVRYRPHLNVADCPEPSEISFLVPDKTGVCGYVINTREGDCGTPIIAIKDGALIGIHSLGGSRSDAANFMAPLTHNIIQQMNRRVAQCSNYWNIDLPPTPTFDELALTSRVDPDEQRKHPVVQYQGDGTKEPFDQNIKGFVAIAALQKRVSMSSKITIDKFACTELANGKAYLPLDMTDYCPSALVGEAYWKDVSKYHRNPTVLPSGSQERVMSFVKHLTPWMLEEQSLIPVGQVYFEVDKTKSSGPRLSGKKNLYMSGEKCGTFSDLVASCESLYDVSPAEFVAPVWQVAIKDELRDYGRVAALKTRTFMSAPIETVLGNLRYVTAFNQRYIQHHLKFASTLGINKFKGGWNDLATYLKSDGRLCAGGDGSRFDSSLGPDLLGINCHIRCLSLNNKYRRHIRNMYSETVYTPLVMMDGIVRVKHTGNPSGSINTSVDNSMCLQSVVYLSLGDIYGDQQALTHLVDGAIRFVVNGDDIVVSLDKTLAGKDFFERLSNQMLVYGLTYTFDDPTFGLEGVKYLSHTFRQVPWNDGQCWIPVLDAARVVAICLYQREDDAVSTHSRYLSALIHSFPHEKLYPRVLKLLRNSYVRSMIDRPFVEESYFRKFPLFGRKAVERLYFEESMGSMDKTYSHKTFHQPALLTGRTYQMASLENETGAHDDAQSEHGGDVIHEARQADDIQLRPQFQAPTTRAKFGFSRGMDSTIANLFSGAVEHKPSERIIVAKSTRRLVEKSIGNLRDLFEIDEGGDMRRLLGDLIVYYGDNSTSEQNPHIFPYEWKGREISYNDIDKCFQPSPRKFFRACADVTKAWLETNPDIEFNWARLHGFPIKYRQYGFDCADYCTDIPGEARLAVQACKDASLTRSPYNLMRADLKAVGFGGGTVVEQVVGSQFGSRGPGRAR